MQNTRLSLIAILIGAVSLCGCTGQDTSSRDIPLPEHPRPDFERTDFLNLNGYWQFTTKAELSDGDIAGYDGKILVPFPWGSELSGVSDKEDIAWYGREISVPRKWEGKRVFLVIGASDWETTVWIDGKQLGVHRGGYTPFEYELTQDVAWGQTNTIRLKVDDSYSTAHLYGKQGYGNARGPWQTVYLEARGSKYLTSLRFSPDIDNSRVKVEAGLSSAAEGETVTIRFRNREQKDFTAAFSEDGKADFEIPLSDQHLWDLDDPYLYEVTATVKAGGKTLDKVDSYFGQRKISAMNVPGKDYKYVSLNNRPIYLQLCLDQSYHPEGFYTFPSDEFMRNEILLSKKLGLNGNRIHIKTELPRKLYWADKLGLLIMADIPNFWGSPVPEARAEWEQTMREQVGRDYNHPSIFAWVDFNETWGLKTKEMEGEPYTPETQEWVRSMYRLTKSLDPTRLVEDNSACNYDHVETDINSWHGYHSAWRWPEVISEFDSRTYVGGTCNYIGGNTIQDVPMINSECGNVWGYDHSSGDCDYTWDYHEMMNSFHRHPKVAGWLYTEHHDVINEWNGYVKFDRTAKTDGLDELVPGMSIKDFHSSYYIVPDAQVCTEVSAGSHLKLDMYSSFTTDKDPGELTLETRLVGWNALAEKVESEAVSMPVAFTPFDYVRIGEVAVSIPEENGLYILQAVLKDSNGTVLHRNFTTYLVKDAASRPGVITFAPGSFSAKEWSIKDSLIFGGLKANGFGSGYFEYTVHIPENAGEVKSAELRMEASSKQLFGKDLLEGTVAFGDFMLGQGTFDRCKSPNSYAMTDEVFWPSEVKVSVNGKDAGSVQLTDDPADHRGILSWHSQKEGRSLCEGGSYGQLVKVALPAGEIKAGSDVVIKLEVPASAASDKSGGLAIYGGDFGRYPIEPCIIIN